MGICSWTGSDDGDHHRGLHGSPDAADRIAGIRASSIPRMVLLHSRASSAPCAPPRLERIEARDRLLRVADRNLHLGKIEEPVLLTPIPSFHEMALTLEPA